MAYRDLRICDPKDMSSNNQWQVFTVGFRFIHFNLRVRDILAILGGKEL